MAKNKTETPKQTARARAKAAKASRITPSGAKALKQLAKDAAFDTTDADCMRQTQYLMEHARLLRSMIRKGSKRVDGDTARLIRMSLHEVIAECHNAVAQCESILHVRLAQATALVDGKRSRAR